MQVEPSLIPLYIKMSGSRKKKAATKLGSSKETINSPVSSAVSSSVLNQTDAVPIGDPFERMLTTPKESIILRASSPRRTVASPLKSKATAEVCLEHLPKISGKREKRYCRVFLILCLSVRN